MGPYSRIGLYPIPWPPNGQPGLVRCLRVWFIRRIGAIGVVGKPSRGQSPRGGTTRSVGPRGRRKAESSGTLSAVFPWNSIRRYRLVAESDVAEGGDGSGGLEPS